MFYAPSGMGPSLKLSKREGVYKASNVVFNPSTMEATSFNWWYFVKRIGSEVVFNDYRYSSFTTRHQRKVEATMQALGIKIHRYIESPKGLQNLGSALEYYEGQIKELTALIRKPGTRAKTNAERAARVRMLQAKAREVRKLIAREARHAD